MAPEDVREYRATQTFTPPTHDPQTGQANPLKDDRHTFSSGASSSGRKPRYDLIPLWALQRIAKRFEMGAEKYGENNWQKGVDDKAFIIDRLNHLIDHAHLAIEHVRDETINSDDDLAAIILNAIFAMGHQRAVGRQPDDIPF